MNETIKSSKKNTSEDKSNDLSNLKEILCRTTQEDLNGIFTSHTSTTNFLGDYVKCHYHFLQCDGNNNPQLELLVDHLLTQITNYAIPRKAIQEAMDLDRSKNSTVNVTRLAFEAQKLFTTASTSGEFGEILLFVLVETFLQIPMLLCKMKFKTSTNMHVHGADGVHVGVNPDTQKLILYWGESKIYKDIQAAVTDCVKSIAPQLENYDRKQRELMLIRDNLELNDSILEQAILSFLIPGSKNFMSVESAGICLIGFDYKNENRSTKTSEAINNGKNIDFDQLWGQKVKNQIEKYQLENFTIHFLFVPFPSVAAFRTRMRSKLGLPTIAT